MKPALGDTILGAYQDRPGLYSPRIAEVAGDLGGGWPVEPTESPGIWREVPYGSNGETRGRTQRRSVMEIP